MARTRWFSARASRIGTTSYAPPKPPWTYRSGLPVPTSELCPDLRPADPLDLSVGREPREERGLCLLEFSTELGLHESLPRLPSADVTSPVPPCAGQSRSSADGTARFVG